MKTAVTYHRVSTADQRPELARDELRAAAAARGLEVLEEIEETGSGARNDRPGLRRVLELARAGRVGRVLVWKLDRFGRSVLDVLTNVQALNRAGVTFVATSQGLEVGADSGPMGNLVLQVLAAIAEFEREIIRERTRLGLKAARAKGVKLGRKSTLTYDQVMRGLRMRELGGTWNAIADKLGTTKGAIWAACTRKQPELFSSSRTGSERTKGRQPHGK